MLSALTTPSSINAEKRWQRVPMPRAFRSSSRPSALVYAALPSPIIRTLPAVCWSFAHAPITNASFTDMQMISSTPLALSLSIVARRIRERACPSTSA